MSEPTLGIKVSIAILVGEAKACLPKLVEMAKALKVSVGFESNTDL